MSILSRLFELLGIAPIQSGRVTLNFHDGRLQSFDESRHCREIPSEMTEKTEVVAKDESKSP